MRTGACGTGPTCRHGRSGGERAAGVSAAHRVGLGAVLLVSLAGVASAAGDVTVRFESGRLSVDTRGEVEVGRVLDTVAREIGADFEIDAALARGRIAVAIEEMEIERALREIVASIPGAGGQTIVYAGEGENPSRIVRVTILGGGGASEGAPRAARALEAAQPAVEPPAPSAQELERQRQRLVERGVSEETARSFVELTSELPRLRRTPGAAEELYESERYRQMIREIAEAQGKGAPSPGP